MAMSNHTADAYQASYSSVVEWLSERARVEPLFLPQAEGEQSYNFQPVTESSQVDLRAYRPTINPPGKLIAPNNEVLFSFTKSADGYQFSQPAEPAAQLLVGVRPCDLKAIALMDRANSSKPGDPLYLRRRANTRIVAMNCLTPCDERCFCAATGALEWREGADLFLTPTGDDSYLVEVLTPAGADLLEDVGWERCSEPHRLREQAEQQRPVPFGRQLLASTESLPAILEQNYNSTVYLQQSERCFSCGTCNLVCPTCYCFDVEDDFNLDAVSGARARNWDACMNPAFAEVAGGHNFRGDVAARQRHRVKRKFEYLTERFGAGSFCVGCGRCGRQCTVDIDIFSIVNQVVTEASA